MTMSNDILPEWISSHLQEVLQRVFDGGGRRLSEQRGGNFPLDPGQLRHLQTHQSAASEQTGAFRAFSEAAGGPKYQVHSDGVTSS